MHKNKFFVITIFILITIFVAYISGTEAAKYINKVKQKKNQKMIDTKIVNSLNELNVGDKLPDHRFEDLKYNYQNLSDIVYSKSVITFMSPTCKSCLDDLA